MWQEADCKPPSVMFLSVLDTGMFFATVNEALHS